ncbi:MAG: efflux RND transporter permease subunit, partial [Candidatus Dadabacteria bacterium]
MLRIIKFTAKNGLIVNVLTLMILIGGIFKVAQMRREAFPAIKVDYIWVITQYPGAGPREVERYVTDPLEREFDTVDGIKRIDSSSMEGLSKITIEIDPDLTELEKDRVVTEVQRAVDQAPDLPDDLPDPPMVHRLDSAKNPIVDITIGGDLPYAELHAIGERYQERIENLPDVDELVWRAEREPEFHVRLDPHALERYQVGSDQVVAALAAQNVNLPGGSYETDHGELLLRSVGELRTPDDIADVVVASNLAGQVVRVRDLGTVVPAFSDETIRVRANGKPVLLFSAMIDATDGDIIRAVQQIRAETDRFLKEESDSRLEVTFINDMSEQVRDRLTVLGSNGLIGIALVVIVLLLFLSKGIAIITALGMPVALVGALLVMAYSGVTLNLITMFAMILVIGMLVDDAIIVAENIWHHYEQGESPWDATLKGTTEVMWPVVATVTTTIAAFSPMLMVSGIFGKFIRWMPITVIIMLTLSLLEALFILPSHGYDMLKLREWWHRRRGRSAPSDELPVTGESGRMHRFFVRHYERLLARIIQFRYLFVVFIFGVLGFSLWWAETQMRL